jgi:hypothetical protein
VIADTRRAADAGNGPIPAPDTHPGLPAAAMDHRAARSREVELLLLCARMAADASAQARIKALVRAGLDWDSFMAAAHQQRVLPLVCRSLERLAARDVPAPAMSRLRAAFHAIGRRNLALAGELVQVLDLFRAHGVPGIPYKGPVLASQVYGNLSFRQFGDLDVIVPLGQVASATELLATRGYRADSEISTDKDITLHRADAGITVELHWGITTDKHPLQIPAELLWRNLVTCSLAGHTVQTHTYEDLLLIHCVHGANHAWDRLAWICDVAEIVRSQPGLDWSRAIGNATALGGRRILLLGLALARDLVDAELPPDVLRALEQDRVIGSLSDQVREWLFSGRSIRLGEREQFFIRLSEHSADKLRVAINQARSYLAPNSRDAQSFPVPPFLSWTLYPFRLVRLGREYGLTPFTRFLRGMF